MNNKIKFLLIFFGIIVIDQIIKYLFTHGTRVDGSCISLVLAYNKGVAFSMFAFLGEYLKYIQVILIVGIIIYLLIKKEILNKYLIASALILAGGISNIADRFFREGVVDYVYWHCGFDFAIFNFADVMIDLGVLLILLKSFKK
jgi:signal peptidase II